MVLNLSQAIRDKMYSALEGMPKISKRISRRKWFRLLVLLRSDIQAIPEAMGIFIRLQHVMKITEGRRLILTIQVNDKLNLCQNLIISLAKRPTHLSEIRPHLPTWIGATDTPLKGI